MITLPSLYAIADIDSLDDPLNYIEKLLAANITLIQLRAKYSKENIKELAKKSVALTKSNYPGAQIIINDYPDICLETKASGVHLGQDDISPEEARNILGENFIIGYYTHSIEQIKAAPSHVLDYLALGPIFQSPTKSGHAKVTGLGMLAEAITASSLPLVAIGGITSENVSRVYETGCRCAAVISDLARCDDISVKAKAYQTSKQELTSS